MLADWTDAGIVNANTPALPSDWERFGRSPTIASPLALGPAFASRRSIFTSVIRKFGFGLVTLSSGRIRLCRPCRLSGRSRGAYPAEVRSCFAARLGNGFVCARAGSGSIHLPADRAAFMIGVKRRLRSRERCWEQKKTGKRTHRNRNGNAVVVLVPQRNRRASRGAARNGERSGSSAWRHLRDRTVCAGCGK